MSISIINNYELNASIFLDSRRSIASLNDLKRISQAQDILYPHGFEVFCVQEGSYYVNISPQGEVPEWKLRLINDEEPSFVSTYSSQKISELLQKASEDDTNIGINDNEPSPVRVYSSQKVESIFAELRQETTRVDDDLLDIDTRVNYLEGEMWKIYGFDGSYDSLTNKPTIPTVPTNISAFTNDKGYITSIPSEYITDSELNAKGYATKDYVDDAVESVDVTSQLSDYAKKSELHSHTNKSVLDGITSDKITSWDNKSTFDGNYNSLTNKPTIPTVPTNISAFTNDKGYITETYVDNAIGDVSSQLGDYVTKEELTAKKYAVIGHTHSQYATTSQLQNLASGSNTPTYVIEEAQMVADKVIEKRNAYSLVISAMSDLHTTGSDTSATGVLHAFQGINEIDKVTPVDLVAIHGDVIVIKMDDTYKDGLKYVRTCMNEVTKNIPLIHMQGNHDELNTDTTEEARQKYFRYIGANNVDVTTDFGNRFRNYGYKDFDDLRIRFIYLNSADLSDFEQTGDLWITPMQYNWFINKALDFSDKEGTEDWQWIVACHHPLNWSTPVSNLQLILKAYTKKTTGSFTFTDPVEGSSTISYDFTNVKQKLICHVHGHIHNFRTEWFDDVLSITVPNACFGRNNEYGTAYGDGSWAQITGGDADENGVQRQFNKTSNTANDTAFVTLVIDSRVNNKIYAYCYGAGIDREIDLTTKEVIYIEKTGDTGGDVTEIPSEVLQYTNLVTTSTDTDGTVFNTTGYMKNSYISTSSDSMGTRTGYITTGFIELTDDATYYVYDGTMSLTESYCRVALYDSSYNKLNIIPGTSATNNFTVTDVSEGIQKIVITSSGLSQVKYVRFSFIGDSDNLYVYSMNENTGGDVVEIPNKPNFNVTSLTTDTAPTVTSKGWIKDVRINSSNALVSETGLYISNFVNIDATSNETIKLYGMDMTHGYARVYYYKDGEYTYSFNTRDGNPFTNHGGISTDNSLEISVPNLVNLIKYQLGSSYDVGNISIRFGGSLDNATQIEDVIIHIVDENGKAGNLLPKAIDLDTTVYNGTGYKTGWRLSGDTGLAKEDANFVLTGFIPWTKSDVVRIKNIPVVTGTTAYIWTYDKDLNPLKIIDNSLIGMTKGVTEYTWDTWTSSIYIDAKYIRISFAGTLSPSTVITVNEEITDNMIPQAPQLFTNLVPTSIDTDGNIYNGTGYKADYRGNSSGTETALDGAIVSGFIPYNQEVIKVYGSTNNNIDYTGYYINFYDASFTLLVSIARIGTLENVEGYYLWTFDPSTATSTAQTKISQAKYIRASMPNCSPSNFVVGLSTT